jgi:hypothetical protein
VALAWPAGSERENDRFICAVIVLNTYRASTPLALVETYAIDAWCLMHVAWRRGATWRTTVCHL